MPKKKTIPPRKRGEELHRLYAAGEGREGGEQALLRLRPGRQTGPERHRHQGRPTGPLLLPGRLRGRQDAGGLAERPGEGGLGQRRDAGQRRQQPM